ncbi:uncharacterized protein LOC131949848 [Physella acuta]|uniref:uncharacterized protein LOC131949848 n=1 Tax=Physella acuta TaxID=109671 RepID=UPI0027DD676C|nr:uncharacterized protein LOC131949848 [Physella acuta]
MHKQRTSQKGIGFKSVFRVTMRPEVHSNGYHIYFDVNSGPMGYILPHWSDDSKQGDTDKQTCDFRWQTKIILPWTEEIRQQIRTHAARFNDIKPSLLLFLHRLKKITIDNKVEGAETFMVRKDLPNGEIHISHNHGTDKWFVLKKVLDTSDMSLQAKSGAEVECTEIALAFPLKNTSAINSQVKYEMQPVFAFLPLRSFGFRFIIQGDFDVPSSREDIDQDSAWNQWLRDEIHLLFLEAFDAFKTKPDIPALEAFVMYLQFIPLEGELLDFFKPVSTQILRQLKAKECVPVLSTDSKSIVWKIPSKTVITHDKLVLRMISPERLQKELDLYYLHPDVAKVLSEPLLHALGINSVTAKHLLHLGQSISQNFKHTDIEEYELFKRIIPLSNGDLVSLTQTTVFLLISTDQSGPSEKKQKADKSRDPLEKLKTDLNLVHFDLVNTQAVKLLQRIGIKQLTAHDLIHSHIMPVLRSDQWRDKHPDIIVSYLIYIKNELDNNPSILDKSELRSVIKLVTNHGVKSPVDVDIHFSTAYGTKIDLFHLLPGIDWVLLDSSYLPIPPTQHDKDTWRSFLQDLGVVEFLKVREVELQVDEINMQELADLPDGYTILDFQCEEFYNLLNNNQQPDTLYEQMGQVFELLNREWESQYQNFVCKEIRYKNGKVHKKTQSTFGKQLQSLPWLPTYSTKVTFDKQSKQLDSQEFHKLQSPVQLYLKQDNIQRLLADTVQYLDVKSQKDTPFTKFLNIKSNVTAEMVKENLISWCTREDDDVPVTFCTRVWHFFEVYAYLEGNLKPKESQDLFHTHPAIFVPLTECDGAGEFCAGLMMRRDEVWWSDYDGLFLKYQPSLDLYKSPLRKFRTLEKMYQEQYKMLKKLFRIQKEPNALYLAELLKHICTIHSLSEEGVLADSLNILSKIGNDLSLADDIEGGVPTQFALEVKEIFPQVMEILQEASMFPTKSNLWVSMKDGPMIADDAELAEMFNSKPGVHFLHLDTRGSHKHEKKPDGTMGNEYLEHLFTLLDVKKLSDCVTVEAVTLMFLPYTKGQTYLHTVVGLLQSFLYKHYPEVYWRVKEKKSGQLKELLVCQVSELKIKYSLSGHEEVNVVKEMDCFVIDKHFYIQKDFITDMDVINRQIAKYFSDGDNSCCREIGRLLPTKASFLDHPSEEFLAEMFKRNELEDLPADEEAWVVSLPVIPVSPVPEPEEEMMVYGKGTDTEDPTTVVECHERQSWPPKLGQEFDPLVVLKIDGNRADNIWPPPAPPEGFISPPQPTITYRSGETTTNISSSATEDSDERSTEDVKQLTGTQPRDHGSTTVSRSSSVLEGPYIHTRIQGEQINKDSQEFQGFEYPFHMPVESTEKYFDTFGQTSGQHGANHGGINFNEPVWTETNKELDYTELKCEQNLITSLQTLADDASLIEVGQWGEKLVWNFLQQQQCVDQTIVDVQWANVDCERGLPYDFKVTCLTDDPNKTKTIYIEVKTTKHWSKENFRISYNQTELAIQQKENFEIYRVYGAGSSSSKLIRIENVAEKMHQQQLRLYLVV